LRKHCCALAKCGFAAVFAVPKLVGLLHLGHIAAKGQRYSSHKNGGSEANRLAIVGYQSLAMCEIAAIAISEATVPDHDGGRPIEVNACILITHMVYL
jgi:hypothetical protein